MLERRHIEMMNDEMVAQNLTEAFDKYCSRQGPSVPKNTASRVLTAPRQRSTFAATCTGRASPSSCC